MKPPPPFEERTIRLDDGREMRVRAIRPDDARRLQDAMRRMSTETRRLRFFTPMRELPDELARDLANVDFADRAALVATLAGEEAIRAIGRYNRVGGRAAEVAFAVEDDLQGHGIATLMLQLLAEIARSNGFEALVGDTLAENTAMLAVFRNSGFPVHTIPEHDVLRVTLNISGQAASAGKTRKQR